MGSVLLTQFLHRLRIFAFIFSEDVRTARVTSCAKCLDHYHGNRNIHDRLGSLFHVCPGERSWHTGRQEGRHAGSSVFCCLQPGGRKEKWCSLRCAGNISVGEDSLWCPALRSCGSHSFPCIFNELTFFLSHGLLFQYPKINRTFTTHFASLVPKEFCTIASIPYF